MKGSLYSLVYVACLGTVCSLLLTGASQVLAPYKQANQQAEQMQNILAVLGVPLPADASARELVEMFEENVRREKQGQLTLYVYQPPKKPVQAVAVPFEGPGVWGPIKGLLALEPDMETIRGISFYEHEETPGLGGEIESDWFRGQFTGKSIRDPQGEWGMVVRTGDQLARNEVAAITGATMTSDKVEALLNDLIHKIQEARGDG